MQVRFFLCILCILCTLSPSLAAEPEFRGRFLRGKGNVAYLQLLDTSRRMFSPDAEWQNIGMLYDPRWNGFTEGPTWKAWWIQNSYGTTLAALPFLEEPFSTFLVNANKLWWDQMGDGKRFSDAPPKNEPVPDGVLCDTARPGWVFHKQGDGRVLIHDWVVEMTAAGVIIQSELLLIRRDPEAIAHYLPLMERSVQFVESRRDPKTDMFLAGPAANLLAPSYAGYARPDGTFGQAYLAGLSITHIAALDRMIEVEKLAGRPGKASEYTRLRDSARRGLARFVTDEGYFIRSIDPDGVKHGVYGAPKHGYFEAAPNHDAIALGVVDETQARKILAKIASIPGLRPHNAIIANYPAYDDLYTEQKGIWRFGHWVNGGHWSTAEARMVLAYFRLGAYDDARRSLEHILGFARQFRMDNPLVDFGAAVYQPKPPINITYDAFGPPAAMIRGLFRYEYSADALRLTPRIPGGITEMEQQFPIHFGPNRLYLSLRGVGAIRNVLVNGKPLSTFDDSSITLRYADLPKEARVQILRGNARAARSPSAPGIMTLPSLDVPSLAPVVREHAIWIANLRKRLRAAGLDNGYEGAHARLCEEMIEASQERKAALAAGRRKSLPDAAEEAGSKLYEDSAAKVCEGLRQTLRTYSSRDDTRSRKFMAEVNPN